MVPAPRALVTTSPSSKVLRPPAAQVEQGSDIFISVWNLHRSPEYWERPNEFDPARFDGVRGVPNETTHNFAYLPFGGGRRKCIGALPDGCAHCSPEPRQAHAHSRVPAVCRILPQVQWRAASLVITSLCGALRTTLRFSPLTVAAASAPVRQDFGAPGFPTYSYRTQCPTRSRTTSQTCPSAAIAASASVRVFVETARRSLSLYPPQRRLPQFQRCTPLGAWRSLSHTAQNREPHVNLTQSRDPHVNLITKWCISCCSGCDTLDELAGRKLCKTCHSNQKPALLPRTGDQFALFEAVVALAMLMRRYDFTLDPAALEVGMTTGATIHTSGGLHMHVKRRQHQVRTFHLASTGFVWHIFQGQSQWARPFTPGGGGLCMKQRQHQV